MALLKFLLLVAGSESIGVIRSESLLTSVEGHGPVEDIKGDLDEGLNRLGHMFGGGGNSELTEVAEPKLVALIDRALFDYADHVDRVAAMRETFGKDPQVSLRFLDIGFPKLEEIYRKWCTVEKECPLDKYATAEGEIKIPADVLGGKLWHMDSMIWAIKQAVSVPSAKWVLVGQDMLFVNRANLWGYLDQFDSEKPLVLGNRLKGYGGENATTVSGWGYVLSRAAAVAMTKEWDGCSKEVEKVEYLSQNGGNLDYGFGYCLDKLSTPAQFVDTRDTAGLDRFMLWPPSRIDKDDWWDSWYPDLRRDSPVKGVSPGVVSFFFASAPEIRALDHFVEFHGSLDGFVANTSTTPGSTHGYSAKTWAVLDGMRAKAAPSSALMQSKHH